MSTESDKLYRSLIEGEYDSRLQESMKNIKVICDEVENSGGRIYVGRVGRLCKEKLGGPAAQSIRNQPDTLKRYIDLRAAEQTLPAAAGRNKNVIQVSDPKIRAHILLLKEELRDCEEQNRILRSLFPRMTPVEMDKLIAEAFSNNAALTLPAAFNESDKSEVKGTLLNEHARQALKKVTSEAHLKLFRLKLYKGRVVDEMNRQFLERDEYQALLDLVAAEDSRSES